MQRGCFKKGPNKKNLLQVLHNYHKLGVIEDILAQVFTQFLQAIVKQKKKLDQPLSYFLGIFFLSGFGHLEDILSHIHKIGLLFLFQAYRMGSTSIFQKMSKVADLTQIGGRFRVWVSYLHEVSPNLNFFLLIMM